jgi:hypothetical protein
MERLNQDSDVGGLEINLKKKGEDEKLRFSPPFLSPSAT